MQFRRASKDPHNRSSSNRPLRPSPGGNPPFQPGGEACSLLSAHPSTLGSPMIQILEPDTVAWDLGLSAESLLGYVMGILGWDFRNQWKHDG
jgi:hypothetical protein